MRNLIRLLEPDRFEDLMALVALYRPGPLNNGLHTEYAERKHGRRKVTYPHPDLEPALANTYGVMVYQEQVMQTAVVMAGFSMGEADTLRKVMGKKKRELIAAERERFIAGCRRARPPRAAREGAVRPDRAVRRLRVQRRRTPARTASSRTRPRT